MLRFLCKRLSITHFETQKCSSDQKIQFLKFLCTATGSCNSNGDVNRTVQKAPLTLNDLIKPCNLPQEFLSRAESSERPNLVINFLQSSGFSHSQINNIVSKRPSILFCNHQTNLKPKICYLRSLGMSELDVANIFSSWPYMFRSSLKNCLIPSFDLLKTLFGEKYAISAVQSCFFTLFYKNDVLNNLVPNLSSLRNNGVPEHQILKLMSRFQFVKALVRTKPERFNKIVSDVTGMGFSPKASSFADALIAKRTDSIWNQKERMYKSFGFSEKEILSMFRKQPRALSYSEKSIRKSVEFFVRKLHWSPSQFSARPYVLTYSLEKRIIPRCSVLQVLVLKNRIKKSMGVPSLLIMTEKNFFSKFVNEYMEKIPEVLDAYQGKLEFDEYNFDSGTIKDPLTL
ncbi:hypothetical protein NMG60_11029554 [Bertholletia excelsa]